MNKIINKCVLFLAVSLLTTSCKESWEQHYGQKDYLSGTQVEIYNGSIRVYMESQSDLSLQHRLFQSANIYSAISEKQQYTVFVYPDERFGQSSEKDNTAYARYCVSNTAISPDMLSAGLGIYTMYGKTIWVYEKAGKILIDDFPIEKCVKTSNAYVYYIGDGVISVRKTVYDVFNELGDEYSIFKGLVKRYEETFFDREKSTPSGYDETGNIVYSDSVFTTRNNLLSRYTSEGLEYWNMYDEKYATTMLVPSNEVIRLALDSANARVTRYMGRPTTVSDRLKFEEWIIKASFYNKRLSIDELNGQGDIFAVGEYIKDTLTENKFKPMEAAIWRTTVQQVNASKSINASNGYIYFIDHLKIPNHILISRLKTIFWRAYNTRNGKQHYKFENWVNPIMKEYGTPWAPSKELPLVYYDYLTAEPSEEAKRNSLTCAVTVDGVLNISTDSVRHIVVPPGEYYLRMGFRNVLYYSFNIYFNGDPVIKGLAPYAHGADFHMDRFSGGALGPDGNPLVGYPEWYDYREWTARDSKAAAYDTDGAQVGVVTVKEEGHYTLRVESEDHARLRDTRGETELILYHWCLRPTKNNY